MWNPVRPQMGRKTRDMMHMMIIVTIVVTWKTRIECVIVISKEIRFRNCIVEQYV